MIRRKILINGIVQGVGFRPFVYRLALAHGITGFVRNTNFGVEIEAQGPAEMLAAFVHNLKNKTPAQAVLNHLESTEIPPQSSQEFVIVPSDLQQVNRTLISPDLAICGDCVAELFDPADRRYLYPFINCTNCGPRLTITKNVPYDRAQTTMSGFKMCPDCQREYDDVHNRRFHAQPNACAVCGPKVWFEGNGANELKSSRAQELTSAPKTRFVPCQSVPVRAGPCLSVSQNAFAQAVALLQAGHILALKGLGGFHLVVDATNDQAVCRLRNRKNREAKPLAIMVSGVERACELVDLSADELAALNACERPIVLAKKLITSSLASSVAPANPRLGIMLPYTPLHHVLLHLWEQECGKTRFPALVMTSGNLSEEPIEISNQEARERLSGIADGFLMHNRDILIRADDSVVAKLAGRLRVIRRSRGHVPRPVFLQRALELTSSRAHEKQAVSERGCASQIPVPETRPPQFGNVGVGMATRTDPSVSGRVRPCQSVSSTDISPPVLLAVGGELKNTLCLFRDQQAFLSQHLGDLENVLATDFFEETVAYMQKILSAQATHVVCDKHPSYYASRWAREKSGLPVIEVQHHHAHMASCMAEHGLNEPVVGVILDGTGFGDDRTIWGGELLVGNFAGYNRAAFLEPLLLPGGDAAIREPWRIAVGYLLQTFEKMPELPFLAGRDVSMIKTMLNQRLNTLPTTSCGRFFDAVAVICGATPVIRYEAQAAIEFMQWADGHKESGYRVPSGHGKVIPVKELIRAVVFDVQQGVDRNIISARFHQGLADLLVHKTLQVARENGLCKVVLSGGVFQNEILLAAVEQGLQKEGLSVYSHVTIPTNDGGLALGQAVVGRERELSS